MNQIQDTLNLQYSAGSDDSVQQFNGAIESYLGSRANTMELLDDLTRNDPVMPLAHCFRGYLLKLAADPRFARPIDGVVSHLKTMELNSREALHQKALMQWAADEMTQALSTLEELLTQYPHDMLALRMAHYLHFYAGTSESMKESIARVFPAWQADDPFYGYLSGMYAFALEEATEYEEAERLGRQAIDYHAADIWAAHAVAHVFQMQGRFEDGTKWIQNMSSHWDGTNNFRYHLFWHNALFYLGQDNIETVLQIYDNQLEESLEDDFYLDMCNASALLWRLKVKGVNTGDRWEKLMDICRRRMSDKELIFSTLHYLLPPAAMSDVSLLEEGLTRIQDWSKDTSTQAGFCTEVGLALADSLRLIAKGLYQEAAHLLKRSAPDIYKIGGSNAQRHLFTLLQEYCENQT